MSQFVKMLIWPVVMEIALSRASFATGRKTVTTAQMKMHVTLIVIRIGLLNVTELFANFLTVSVPKMELKYQVTFARLDHRDRNVKTCPK